MCKGEEELVIGTATYHILVTSEVSLAIERSTELSLVLSLFTQALDLTISKMESRTLKKYVECSSYEVTLKTV